MFLNVSHFLGLVVTFACHPLVAVLAASAESTLSAYTVPGAFPTSLYSTYYNNPTATSAQPQPVISDPVTVKFCHSCRATEANSFFSMTPFRIRSQTQITSLR